MPEIIISEVFDRVFLPPFSYLFPLFSLFPFIFSAAKWPFKSS